MHDMRKLVRIQAQGSMKAESLNFPVRRMDPTKDLFDNCPYAGNTIEALAWSAGYWSSLAGIYSGDITRMLAESTR